MKEVFDKTIFVKNVKYLLKKKMKKISELESSTESSKGYFSRIQKEESAKPVIDFIMETANFFGISIDTLLKVDLAQSTQREMKLKAFLEKLIELTRSDKLDWHYESKDEINEMIGSVEVDHPLFEQDGYWEDPGSPIPTMALKSETFGKNSLLAGPCFYLKMKNEVLLYVASVTALNKKALTEVRPKDSVIEVLMVAPRVPRQFLGGTLDTDEISALIEELYGALRDGAKYPRVNEEYESAIDDFLSDNIGDWKGEVM